MHHRHDDWKRTCRLLSRFGTLRARCHDDVDGHPDQLDGKLGKALESSFSPSFLDDEVRSVRMTQVTEALPEGVEERSVRRGRAVGQPADANGFRLLCLAHEWRRERGDREDDSDRSAREDHAATDTTVISTSPFGRRSTTT